MGVPMRRVIVSLVCVAALLGGCTPSDVLEPPQQPKPPVPLAIWSSRDLPAGLDARLAGVKGVKWVARVSVGMVNLVGVTGATKRLPRRRGGGILPMAIAAMDPPPGDPVTPALTVGSAVLSQTAATLRGLVTGDSLTIEAGRTRRSFRIGAVVPDDDAHGRELIIPLRSASGLGLTATRGLIASLEGDHAPAALREVDALTTGVRVRVRTGEDPEEDPTEGPILAFADVKRIFGEFTYTPRSSGLFVTIDKSWEDANIVKVRVPLLGLIACNKRLIPQLTGAMRELIRTGLSGLVKTYNGCFSPRMQVGNSYALSRHAFGIAVDLNAGRNRYGDPPRQDPRLVQLMERWGFSWGGGWLVPDGMHFEFVRFVNPS